MGRLIDADKLKRKCQKTATEAWKMKIKAPIETTLNQFIDWIDQAEPVDAVPVSWIMAQVEERKERGTAFDLSVASTLRTMVKEWKDETD